MKLLSNEEYIERMLKIPKDKLVRSILYTIAIVGLEQKRKKTDLNTRSPKQDRRHGRERDNKRSS